MITVTNIVASEQPDPSLSARAAGASARYGDNQRFVQVIVGEFPQLVMQYPILLSKDRGYRRVLLRRHAGLG